MRAKEFILKEEILNEVDWNKVKSAILGGVLSLSTLGAPNLQAKDIANMSGEEIKQYVIQKGIIKDKQQMTDLVKELDRVYGNTPTATTASTAQPIANPVAKPAPVTTPTPVAPIVDPKLANSQFNGIALKDIVDYQKSSKGIRGQGGDYYVAKWIEGDEKSPDWQPWMGDRTPEVIRGKTWIELKNNTMKFYIQQGEQKYDYRTKYQMAPVTPFEGPITSITPTSIISKKVSKESGIIDPSTKKEWNRITEKTFELFPDGKFVYTNKNYAEGRQSSETQQWTGRISKFEKNVDSLSDKPTARIMSKGEQEQELIKSLRKSLRGY
jgi:hypothetical protein